jgi:hypothetical protein
LNKLNLDALNSPYRAIYEEAYLEAKKAYDEYFAKHGEPMYCGFAWVRILNGKHPFVNWCKKVNLGSKHWQKGYQIWNPIDDHTQSMDLKEVASDAFAKVLRKHGIDAYMESRAD